MKETDSSEGLLLAAGAHDQSYLFGKMPSIIHLQPFNGVHEFTPFCYLLEIDGFGILLDCGWDEQFNEQYIEELSKYVLILDIENGFYDRDLKLQYLFQDITTYRLRSLDQLGYLPCWSASISSGETGTGLSHIRH